MKIIAAGSDTFSQLMRLKIKFILVICFILHFDSKTSILAISEKQNAVKMGINGYRPGLCVNSLAIKIIRAYPPNNK